MLRAFFEIAVPLVLPTALYFLWVWSVRRLRGREATRGAALPWIWLAGAGAVLLAIVLFVVNVNLGTSTQGVYVPPRWVNGRIVPGHIEPAPQR